MADIDTIKPVADDIAQAEKEVAAIIAAYKSNGASGVCCGHYLSNQCFYFIFGKTKCS